MTQIIIDFGLWDYHTRAEKNQLMKQVFLSWVESKKCPDIELVFSSCPDGVKESFLARGFKGKVLKDKYESSAILLDPHAEKEVKKFDKGSYVLGGMVDKSNRMRTVELGYDFPRRSIRYRGKAGLVSNRLNHIVKIICLNKQGMPIKKAIEQSSL